MASRESPIRVARLRAAQVGRFLQVAAVGIICFVILVWLPYTWFMAWWTGSIQQLFDPNQWRNHGPWQHNETMQACVAGLFELPPIATVLALMGWLLAPTLRGLLLVFLLGATTVALFVTHFWVID